MWRSKGRPPSAAPRCGSSTCVPIFTPDDSYRDAITIDGKQTIVRESDGIHLNEEGSSIAADLVLQAVGKDFDY